ncbi:MAG: hypothetical protein AAF217_15240 [Pseudomonadota bacterium]
MYVEAQGSEFAEKLLGYLQQVDYRVAESNVDREKVYRLRYQAYLEEGAIDQNPSKMFHDDYDNFENCWIFGIYIDDKLVSSIRCHAISPEFPKGPAIDVFPDIVGPMVHEQGLTVVDPTRFVADPDAAREFPELPYLTLRVACMTYDYFDAEYCLATVRKEHASFYRRVFRAEMLCEPRPYPTLKAPICLMKTNVAAFRSKLLRRYPIFESSFTERRMLFDLKHQENLRQLDNPVTKLVG